MTIEIWTTKYPYIIVHGGNLSVFISCHGSKHSVNVFCIMLNINRVIKKSLVLFQFHSDLSLYGETLSRKYLEYHLDKKPVWKYFKKISSEKLEKDEACRYKLYWKRAQ